MTAPPFSRVSALCRVRVLGVGAAQAGGGEGGTGLEEPPLCLRRLLTSQNRKFNQAPVMFVCRLAD